MALADWIMRVAVRNPPPGREKWTQAMQAEFASLSTGRLSWAFGCWTAMIGWRLRADGLYVVALVTTVVLLYFTAFAGWLTQSMPRSLFDLLVHQLSIPPGLALMLLAAIALNALKPSRPLLTGLTLIAMQHVHWVVNDWYVHMRWPQATHANGPLFIYSAPPFVGVLAQIGICCVGALIGGWIAGSWRGDQPKSSAHLGPRSS